MTNHKSGFRIGPEPESDPRPSERNRPVEGNGPRDRRKLDRLGRRLSWLSILLPLLAVLIAALAYSDLRRRMDAEPEREDATLERTAELRERIDALEQALRDSASPIDEAFLVFERTNAAVQEDIRRLDIRIDQLRTGKAEIADLEAVRIDLEERVAAVSGEVAPLREDMAAVRENLADVRETLDTLRTSAAELETRTIARVDERTGEMADIQDELTAGVASLAEGNARLRAELDQMAEQIIEALRVVEASRGRGDVDAALAAQKREMEREMAALKREINASDGRARTLRRDMDALQRRVESLARQRQQPLGTPDPGTVLEQDLQ
jgi:chromosome segregation ATPase